MRWMVAGALGALLMGVAAGEAGAAPVTDCPARDAPFSVDSPLMDILLNPAARGVVEADMPELFKALPPRFFTTQAPTFSAILTIRQVAEARKLPQANVAKVEAALRALPVTAADRQARCARYDDERPTFDLPAGKPRLLIFEKMTGFRDGPSVEAARAAFEDIAQKAGWATAVTDKGGAIAPDLLRQFDAVVWNNVSGDVLTVSQRKALKDYVEGGGGFIAVHGAAGDPAYFWDWYVDGLIGARFKGHPGNPQFQDARVVVEGKAHPVAAGLPDAWVMKDEWYSFKTNPRASGSDIIATLDEASYAPGEILRMGDHPIAWSRCVGKGRMFYAAIGHKPETYVQPHYVTMLRNALGWVREDGVCRRGGDKAGR